MIQKTKFKITGMHCVSCAMNIDGELEDTTGVKEASTSFAKAQTEVQFDSDKLNHKDLVTIIKKAGYEAEEL